MRQAALKNVTILDLIYSITKRYENETALQIEDQDEFKCMNYGQLRERSVDVSAFLIKNGIKKDDRVAILSESRPEWAVAFFGIVSAAGITVPMDAKLSETEIKFILKDSGARCIFISEHFLPVIQKCKSELPSLEYIICLDSVNAGGVISFNDVKWEEGLQRNRPQEVNPEDTMLIVYTSGTTGVAKGVELSYKNLLFEVMTLYDLVRFSPEDHFVSILPLNHMLEITGGLIAPLYGGAAVTYCKSLKPTNILSLMQNTGATGMICVPLILKMFYNGIIKEIERLPKFQQRIFNSLLSVSKILLRANIRVGKIFFRKVHNRFGGRLRCFICGGAPLDPVIEENFNAAGFTILQGYGLTETSPVLSVNTFKKRRYGSVGRPLDEVEIKILSNSETGDKVGEIIARGPNIMKGYYNNPEKTQEVLRDGWFHTGDIGYLDKDGFLFISGRIKNLIVLGAGKKVFPEEVEEVMSHSPYIKEICVLGRVASKGMRKGTEEVYAVVVPNLDQFEASQRTNESFVKEKIASEINELSNNLAEYKRIMDFELWKDELPKTSTRKVKRKVLIEAISAKEKKEEIKKPEQFIEASDVIDDDLTQTLKEVLAGITNVDKADIQPYSNLYNELRIDSLMKVELLCAVEKRLGIKIPDEIVYEINTFSDLVRFAKEYKQGRTDDVSIKDEDIDSIVKKNFAMELTRTLSYFVLKLFAKIYFRLQIKGIENIPKDKSFIIAANHSSHLDFPLLFVSLPFSKSKDAIAPAAQDYFYAHPLRRKIIECAFNTFAFERMGNFVHSLKVCAEIIKRGKSIILFPEGTRSKEGKLQEFKPGIGSLSFDLDVPIIPAYIEGAFNALAKGGIFPRPRKIIIHFGNAIHPGEVDFSNSKSTYEKYIHLTELVFNEAQRMRKEFQDV